MKMKNKQQIHIWNAPKRFAPRAAKETCDGENKSAKNVRTWNDRFFSLHLLFRMPSLRQHPLRHETRWSKKKSSSDIDTEYCVNDIHIRNGKTQWKRKVHTSEIICLLTHSAQRRENKRNANRKISERTHSHCALNNNERVFQLTEDRKKEERNREKISYI